MEGKYYIGIDIRNGAFKSRPILSYLTINSFITYLINEQPFKLLDYDVTNIINNLNYVSFVYFSTTETQFSIHYDEDDDDELYKGDYQWLKTNYEDIYNELIKNGQAIIGFMMVRWHEDMKEEYRMIEAIGSRIKNSKLREMMMRLYIDFFYTCHDMDIRLLPHRVTIESAPFWHDIVFTKETVDEIIDEYRNAYEPEYFNEYWIKSNIRWLLSYADTKPVNN